MAILYFSASAFDLDGAPVGQLRGYRRSADLGYWKDKRCIFCGKPAV